MNRFNDWYNQGKRDLERARLDMQHKFYEWTCFTSHQASKKVLKAVAMKLGFDIWGRSLTEILRIISQKIQVPEQIVENAKQLDLYYIPTRYPNGFSSGKPADYFTERQAREAIDAADNICKFCESHLFG